MPTDVATSLSAFNQLKAWRGIASRYHKHATIFRGALVFAPVLLLLRH